MAKEYLLECLEKRDLLNDAGVSEAILLDWGQRFEQAGLLNDAVEFYDKADAKDDLRRILQIALDEGDLFLYSKLCRLLGYEASRDQWLALADKAEEAGKLSFAAEARRKGGVVEGDGESG
jgi:hypothetical protein